MAQQTRTGVGSTGPGSRPIAVTLLETLTSRGRLGDRQRAAREADLDGDRLAEVPRWLESDAIARMLAAASIEVPAAVSLGHRLVAPESLGMPLYALGLATPEKAYRRIQTLLPREAPEASWVTEQIEGESARLAYQPHALASDATPLGSMGASQAVACSLRRGMLEAIPTLYGLLPATVRDEQCVARGDAVCRYRVRWHRGATRGLLLGSVLGGSLGAGLLALSLGLGAAWLAAGPAAIGALASLGLGAAIGRGFDLKAQLEAVAGARRGQLALFDQVDDQLAAKLDALARAGAKLEPDSAPFRAAGSAPNASASGSDPSQRERDVLAAAQAIHSAAGDLECWFEGEIGKTSEPGEASPRVGAERAHVREIREWAVRIVEEIAPQAGSRQVVDLTTLVARAVACVQPTLVAGALVQVEAEPDLEPVLCEPVQIEQVVVQLVRNAIEASQTLSATPEARVTLRQLRAGIEIAVEDRGTGIDSSEVDEVFDPFFGEPPLGDGSGFGLPTCLRIVEAHGGEMRIEAEDRPGTRVSILLPRPGQEEEVAPGSNH
ncbi:MAG: hypothetical protein JRJ58_11700 [Deltaproteobacteria bacterium]|nr:hypothetical protein [Deltaproteobacteria bacterium]